MTPCATSNEVAWPTESDVPPVGGWGLWPTFRHTESTKETSEMRETDKLDDGLTCDPCKEWRCFECEGGACWHECPDDGDDPADSRRYLSGSCWAGNCGECTDRACEHNCGHEAGV